MKQDWRERAGLEGLGLSLLLRGALGTWRSPQPRPEPWSPSFLLPILQDFHPPQSLRSAEARTAQQSLKACAGVSQKVPRWGTLGTTLPSRPSADTRCTADVQMPLGPLEIVVATRRAARLAARWPPRRACL